MIAKKKDENKEIELKKEKEKKVEVYVKQFVSFSLIKSNCGKRKNITWLKLIFR